MKKVEELKGCFVKRKPTAKKVFYVEGYNRSTKKWMLQDAEDHCNIIEVKKGTLLTEIDY